MEPLESFWASNCLTEVSFCCNQYQMVVDQNLIEGLGLSEVVFLLRHCVLMKKEIITLSPTQCYSNRPWYII